MVASRNNPQHPGFSANWLAPTPLNRARALERASRIDRVMGVISALCVAVLVWSTVERGPWALAPLGAVVAVTAFGPLAVRRVARPEYWSFASGMLILTSVAIAAAMTGAAFSPIGYLLAPGLAVFATQSIPRATVICALVTAGAFLTTCLLRSPSTLIDHPLATSALLVSIAIVTMASTVLAGAEIAYRSASVLDPLTGLLNRQALEDRFEELREQARLLGAPICLVLFDLDHFKAINDEHGHDVGDAILREVAYQVRKSLRAFELVYRMGGEEFLVVLPGIGESEGAHTAEQLRETIDQVRLGGAIRVTASFGVSSGTDERIDFESLYRRADQALYRAKQAGRDRIGTSEPSSAVSA
jgi:diguanylate cyclase (GGDEF)-like protein